MMEGGMLFGTPKAAIERLGKLCTGRYAWTV